jgi:hypothetical protein
MTTGKLNLENEMDEAVELRFSANRMIVQLHDGRSLSVPLEFYPSLQNATPAQRRDWEMIGPGRGFHWPRLDLDLSVEGILQGLREAIPAPPPNRARKSTH